MSSFNRGEWSEIYAILCMLVCPELSVGNADLEEITNKLYKIKKIQIANPNTDNGIIEYCLNNNCDVEVYYDNELDNLISMLELNENKHRIFDAIQNAPIGNGAFEIEGIENILVKLTRGNKIKARSFSKEDLEATVLDKRIGKDASLKYSIKSSLGSPATLLNASNHTNFLYSITGLDEKYIDEINSIETRTKLLDRINFITSHGGKIKFERIVDQNLEYNLRMIDTLMPEYLANVLLNSYIKGTKDLKDLFLTSNQFIDEDFALKKLGDLLEGISFGFFPSIKWDGINNVNGGLVIVKNDGNVIILDLVYYRNEVLKFLIKETKLDSPSSSRYNMLHLEKDLFSDKIFFTLNLQIRYKE
ncbi:MAG: HpaII family restriction endonuclease [Erysipelotrichaceae bacterium]|nr:HpaII family restriction endonuclease [Bacteroidaceae bacterium]MEA5061088.1 HpaII family restriction endonuclease [Erysipelotrichaceae bacterium]